MKKILISCLAISSLSFASVENAKAAMSEEIEKAVNAKCYVELIGGGEAISLWLVKPSELKSLAQTVVGQEISIIPKSKKKLKNRKAIIYKARQCVLEESDFSNPRAREMDKKTPR